MPQKRWCYFEKYCFSWNLMNNLIQILKGGSGSGDFGHTGRAGKRGGSGGGGGKGHPRKGRRSREALNKEIEAEKKKSGYGSMSANLDSSKKYKKQIDKLTSDMDKDYYSDPWGEISSKVVDTITKRSGVDKSIVENFINGWNGVTDRDNKIKIISSISEELNVEFSDHERKGILSAGGSKSTDDYKKVARAIYDETQELLASRGIKEALLHRGILAVKGTVLDKTGNSTYNGSSVESWSTGEDVAYAFATNSCNEVLPKEMTFSSKIVSSSVPASRIFSMGMSGAGTSMEREYIVLGSKEDGVSYKDYGIIET